MSAAAVPSMAPPTAAQCRDLSGALAAMGPPIHVSGNTFIGNWDPSTESQIMQAIRKAMRRGL